MFPVSSSLVYFNHAAVGPLSARACEAMEFHARDQRDFGALHWREWDAEVVRVREAAGRLIGATPGEIAIVKNTSEGLSFVAQGLRWRAGDNVVTTALEFPSNWIPWKRLEGRGVECRVAAGPTIAEIEPLVDARTRLVSVSAVAFHNGTVAELDAIGALCKRRGVRFCVDAIQALGVLPIDVRRSGIDFLCADGHKWLCGPEGAAIFYVAGERLEELDVLEDGWMNIDRKGKFLDCPIDLLPDSRRFEAGSFNTTGIYGLRAALDLIAEVGLDFITSQALAIAGALAAGLESIRWTIRSPKPIRSPIIAATPPVVEKSIRWYHHQLEQRGIICAPREGLLRLSPHYYNDREEVARVVEALADLD